MKVLYTTISPVRRLLKRSALLKFAGKSILPAMALCIALLSFTANKVFAQVSLTASGGTASATYTTLNSAFAAINAGTHTGIIAITITANTNEPATPVPLLASGTAGSSYTAITIMPSGDVSINSDAAPVTNRGIIELAGADNVTIDGDDPLTAGDRNLSIVAAPVTTAGVACIRLSSNSTTGADGADNNTIKNCIITGSRSSATSTATNYGIQFSNGVSTSSSSTGAYSSINTLIQNNVITRCYYGMNAIGNSVTYLNTGTRILNNTIGSATAASYVAFRGIAVSYTSATPGTTSALIEGNDIRVGHTSGNANQYALEISSANAGIKVTRNNIHDCINPSSGVWGMYGVGISSATSNAGITITNNFIRDIAGYPVSSLGNQYGGHSIYINSGATGIVINNNTIVQQASGIVGCGIFVNTSAATIAQCLNNILVVNATSQYSCAFYTNSTSNISAGIVNNNNYYVTSPSLVGYYNGGSRATLANWQSATGKDGLAINENPVFTSATDLHMPNGSISFLESAGATVATTGVNVDIDNQTRPGPSTFGFGTAPDIGADEFDGNVAYTCATPNPGATLATNIPLCSGANTTLSLANSTTGTGVTYQWQSSATLGGTYVDSVGATLSTYTITPNQNGYYRCKVTCANGPATTISTPVLVTFVNSILATTPGTRCGAGTLSLSATGNAGSVLKWYSSASSISPLGTGTSFTTPAISSNTNFYVAAEAANSGILGAGATVGSNYDAIFYHSYGGCQTQFLIKASELQAMGITAGNINNIGINVNAAAGSYAGLQISIGTTNNADMSAGLSTGTLNTVYTAANYTPSTGVNTFPFSSAFVWDGTSNLIVKFCWSNNNSGGTNTYAKLDNVGFVACAYFRQDSQTPATICGATTGTGTTSNRPQFFINVCSSARVAVAATVTPAPTFTISPNTTACNNAVTALTVLSSTADFNNVTWTPSTNLFTNAAATIPYTGTNTNTVYFKSGTSGTATYFANALNTISLCGNIDTVAIQTLPATASVLAATAISCQSGSSALTITPSITQTGVKYQWQSSTDNSNNNFNDIPGANGATYTTPTVSNTTYYRVTVKDSNNVTCFNSGSDTVKINNPLITGPVSGERCGPGTVNLVAANNGDGSVTTWYDAATAGNVVSTGPNFTTPSLTATTSYWAEASIGSTAVVGPVSPAAQGGTIATQTVGWDVNFNVLQSTTLTSVDIYPVASGETGVIRVQTGTGFGGTIISTINYTTNVSGGTTPQTIQINTPLAPGTYSLYTSTLPASGLKRNTSGAVYPYTSAMANITGNGYDATYFMGMYKWVFGNRCASPRVQITATVNTVPTAGITPTGTVQLCAGNTTTLTGTGGGTYQWRNAAGNLAGVNTSSYTTGVAGNYRVYVTTPAGCTDTSATVNVVVNPLPVVNLGNDTTFCSGSFLVLNAGTSGNAYLWDNSNTAQTRVVNTSGNYYVKVTNSFNCIKRDTILVTVNPSPGVDIGNDAFVCTGVSYTMNAGNAGSVFLWDNNSTAQTRTVNTSGTYSVKVTNSFNCSKNDTAVITYLPSPIVNLGPDKEGCAGDVVALDAGNPGNVYLWDNGSTQQTRGVLSSGTYYVKVTNAANCHGYDTVSVDVHALPVVNLGPDLIICHDEETTLNAGNPGSSYLWNDSSTLQTLVVNASGDYEVHVTDNNNCIGTDAVNVFVKPLPSGVINAVHGDTATYTFNVLNPQYVSNYTWNFGDASPLVSGSIVQHRYAQNGLYHVSVMLTGECNDSTMSSRTVEVYDVIGGGTGIQQVGKTSDLTLYPNPAKDLVMVENLGTLDLKKITVYNVIGQTVYSVNADNKLKHKIDVSRFVPGMYTVRVETSGGIIVRKFEILK